MSIDTVASPVIMMMAEKPSIEAGYSAVVLFCAESVVITRSSER